MVFVMEVKKKFFGESKARVYIEDIFSSMDSAEDYVVKEFEGAILVHCTDYSRVYSLWHDLTNFTITIMEWKVRD